MNRIEHHPILSAKKNLTLVNFSFDGEEISGYEGEPVASALISEGRHVFSYHFRDGFPQGLFCANGQCSQCTMLIDGIPKKSCVTPLAQGMDVRTIHGLPRLPSQDSPLVQAERRSIRTDILIIGAGPAGPASAEAGPVRASAVPAGQDAAGAAVPTSRSAAPQRAEPWEPRP